MKRFLPLFLTAGLAILLMPYPDQRWWSLWALLLSVAAILHNRYEQAQDKKAEERMEDNTDCKVFYTMLVVVFFGGLVWGFRNGLSFWKTLGFGMASLFVYFTCFICAVAAGKENPEHSQS